MTLEAEREGTSAVPFFAAAMRGEPCTVHGLEDLPHRLPMTRWAAQADVGDAAVLAHCTGPTLDVGCGPGRMSEHLAARGIGVLGIDIVPEAVEQTQARGASALHRDVFDHLPGEGRWVCALLADGNIGIGGDPVALLRRMRAVVSEDGRVVVDLTPPGTGLETGWVRLETERGTSRPLRWAWVGVDAIDLLAAEAGLSVAATHDHGGRWFTVLERSA
jgi:SAM-dependent methyltransferase